MPPDEILAVARRVRDVFGNSEGLFAMLDKALDLAPAEVLMPVLELVVAIATPEMLAELSRFAQSEQAMTDAFIAEQEAA